jgi:hypothetical protein
MSGETRAAVRHTKLGHRSVAAGLAKIDTMYAAGARCQEVLASPLAALALEDLRVALAATHACFAAVVTAVLEERAVTAALAKLFARADATVRVYERNVDAIAAGDAAIIAGAGLLVRDASRPRSPLGTVTALAGKPGKRSREAILSWPAAKGARGYAVEVSFTPESPDGPWTSLPAGFRRRRTIVAPAPGAEILARVAAVDGQGNRSEWSPAILVAAR